MFLKVLLAHIIYFLFATSNSKHSHLQVPKKLGKLSKQTDCELVGEWITNHLYWCAANGVDGDDILKRWKSLMDHIRDESMRNATTQY